MNAAAWELRTVLMYVCLCNGLTEGHIRNAANAGASRPSEVYNACGCTVDCGTCSPMVRRIVNDVAGRSGESPESAG